MPLKGPVRDGPLQTTLGAAQGRDLTDVIGEMRRADPTALTAPAGVAGSGAVALTRCRIERASEQSGS